jgi:ubiquinone/menaquinone biosynthesis C-methylase UbiE
MSIPTRFEWTRQSGIGPGISVLGPLTRRTVIEIGCGSGHNIAHLAAAHCAVGIGIDHDPVRATRARDLYGRVPNLAFIVGDAAEVLAAMPPASADVCLSIFGALSFSPQGPILNGAARVLRPGGLPAITVRVDDHHDYVIVLTRKKPAEVPSGGHTP